MLLFCETYILNGRNGADAYLKAYPISAKHTNQYRAEKASKLLAQAKIQGKIRELDARLADKVAERFDISADRVIQELAAMAFAKPRDYYEFGQREIPILDKKTGMPVTDKYGNVKTRTEKFTVLKNSKDLTDVQLKAVVQIGETISRTGDKIVEVKLADKRGALNDIARIMGYVKTKVEHTGANGGPIETSHEYNLPNLDGVTDPKEMLRAFEDFRMGRINGRPN